jgi:hypothetical protein
MGIIGGLLYTGSTDGYIRRESVMTDTDDDNDDDDKTLLIQTRHEMPDQGGNEQTGFHWPELGIFARSQDVGYTLQVWGGEEYASEAASPHYSTSVSAGAASGFVSKNRWHFKPPSLQGQGVTLRLTWTAPTNVSFRGYELVHTEGVQPRPAA